MADGSAAPETLLAKGYARLQSGDLESAIPLISSAVAGFRSRDNRRQLVAALGLLCSAQRMAGLLDDALESAGVLVTLGKERNEALALALGLYSSGEILFRLGRVGEAAENITRSIEHFEGIPSARGNLGDAQYHLGLILLRLGKRPDAREAFARARASYEAARLPLGVANSLVQSAQIDLMSGSPDRAQQALDEAEKAQRALGDTREVANTLVVRGALHTSRGNYADADSAFEEAAQLFRALGAHVGQATALIEKGKLLLHMSRLGDALTAFEEAASTSRRANEAHLQARALEGCGEVRFQQGRGEDAQRSFAEAERLFAAVKDDDGVRRMSRFRTVARALRRG
jgi:tetratricopeptide (TPR) repeat protein